MTTNEQLWQHSNLSTIEILVQCCSSQDCLKPKIFSYFTHRELSIAAVVFHKGNTCTVFVYLPLFFREYWNRWASKCGNLHLIYIDFVHIVKMLGSLKGWVVNCGLLFGAMSYLDITQCIPRQSGAVEFQRVILPHRGDFRKPTALHDVHLQKF